MSDLASVEKLRTAARNMAKGRPLENHEECNLLLLIADEIEREVSERYISLPVDADGVPIRIGDMVELHGETLVNSMTFDGKNWYVSEAVISGDWVPAHNCRHVKPRTIEDVLRDCCNEWNQHLGSDWEAGVYAKYADELHDLIGGEAV